MSIPASVAGIGKIGEESKVSTLSKEDQQEKEKLDTIFERLRKSLPESPYIVKTQWLAKPYHRHSEQERNSWLIGDLWESREEFMQYMSWKYRSREGTVLELRSAVDDRMEKKAALASSRDHQANPAPATTIVGAKKMKFGDYQANKANGTRGTPLSKKPSPDLPPVQVQQPQQPQTNGVKPAVNGHLAPVEASVQHGVKRRYSPPDLVTDYVGATLKVYLKDAPPPAKKAKPSSPAPTQHSKSSSDVSLPTNATPHGLPPLLSPTSLPPPYGLPRILSPTLPANIQAELKRIEARKRTNSNASSSSDVKSKALPVFAALATKGSDESLKGVVRKVKVNGDIKSRAESSVSKPAASTPVRNHVQEQPPKELVVKAKSGLLVKLKYPKKLRSPIERILRLPPASKALAEKQERAEMMRQKVAKARHTSQEDEKARDKAEEDKKQALIKAAHQKATEQQSSTAAINTASTTTSTTTTVAKPAKRPRPADNSTPSQPAKRAKVPAALEVDKRPSTPSDQTIPSPALTNVSSAQKSHQGSVITPRKDLRAVNMIRNASSPGIDVTPGHGSTPNLLKPVAGALPTSHPVNEKELKAAREWHEYQKRATKVGRDLKHEADRLEQELKHLTPEKREASAMRVAAMSIEVLLSFMVTFHAQDAIAFIQRRQMNIDQTWRTVLALATSAAYKSRMAKYKELDSLRRTLTAIISTRIIASPHAVYEPEKPAAELRRAHKDMTYFLQTFSNANAALPLDKLMERFPETWAKRSHDTPLPIPQKDFGNYNDLTGPYWLPINVTTYPIHGVRFGMEMLREVLKRSAGSYELTIDRLLDGRLAKDRAKKEKAAL